MGVTPWRFKSSPRYQFFNNTNVSPIFLLFVPGFVPVFQQKPRVFVALKATNRSGVAGIHRGFTTSANFIEGDYVDYTQRQNNESKVINRTELISF